jgi:CheY-like chemotaxis protein/serine/threonine protein kinase
MVKILIVEDNELNRDMLSRRLERKGYQVISASDGQEGVAKAKGEKPDLILMDMSLPVLDGWAATRQLKATPATQSIPVIALTAHAMVGDRERALAAGCNDYEVKPVDLPRLLEKINALVSKKDAAPAEKPFHLLITDDNEMNRDMLSRRLERQGYRVTTATTGAEALDFIRKQPFDLVLLDVMMPEMNGMEVLGIIRASYSLLDLPVIMVTAKDQSEDVVAALQMGANDYVTKPLNFPVVLARIQTHLAVRQAHQVPGQHRQEKLIQPSAAAALEQLTGMGGMLSRPLPAMSIPAESAGPRKHGTHVPSALAESWHSQHSDVELVTSSSAAATAQTSKMATLVADPSSARGRGPLSGSGAPHLDHSDPPRDSSDSGRGTWIEGLTSTDKSTLAGYQILEELGRGGMGIVYKARHERMNRLVALKVIHKEHLNHPDAIRRFYREIQAAAQLHHPNLVMAYDAGHCGETHFFAMEYIEGIDLSQLVKQSGALRVETACDYVRQAALGLQHAHERGLVHRDIKPSNMLVTWADRPGAPAGVRQGRSEPATEKGSLLAEKGTLKILDLGLALLHQPTELSENAGALTRDGRVVGTADYMAPEQWMNAHKVDIRADLYSLGCTFYFLLTGRVPFPGNEPMEKMLKHHLDEPVPVEQLRPRVPAKVLAIVRRLLAKKPEQRYQQPLELAEALREPLS